MPKPQVNPCPKCKSRAHVDAVGVSGEMFYCRQCRARFDNEPNEGGDHHDRFVDARLLRAEQQRRPVRHVR